MRDTYDFCQVKIRKTVNISKKKNGQFQFIEEFQFNMNL